jgi:betaine-aldehyde dehydrogenase
VVGVIVPWNFPMPIAGWGFAPALAAGNTVVLKPAEVTPLTAIRLAELALEAGLPAGVFTVIPGQGSVVGDRFVTHPLVRKVCFTGSTAVGKQIMAGSADQVKRVTLELGGKSANIIFADADLAAAAASAPGSVFDNAGQDCCARSRILVQRSVYDAFLSLLEPAVRGFRVRAPGDPQAEMGPLITAGQLASVSKYVDGTDVAFTGSIPASDDLGGGFWYPPTVVLPASTADRIWREEVFGPVVAVLPFEDEADAIALANDSDFGLSGSIFTADVGRALRVARGVEAGNLSVNSHSSVRYWTPFGGFKQSGLGRELGPDAPAAFSEVKNVFIATG